MINSYILGPFGHHDGELVFIQKIVPETNEVFVRLASNGDRYCTYICNILYVWLLYIFRISVIKSVDDSSISSFLVHECEGSNRMGSRPRRYLFTGHSNGSIQVRKAPFDIYSFQIDI